MTYERASLEIQIGNDPCEGSLEKETADDQFGVCLEKLSANDMCQDSACFRKVANSP